MPKEKVKDKASKKEKLFKITNEKNVFVWYNNI